MSKTVGIIGAAGGLLTFILEVVSLATPYWIEFEYSLGSSGLWQSCTRSACNSFSNVPDYFKAVQAFMIIGCLFLAVAFGVSVIVTLGKSSDSTPKIITSMIAAAGLSILIALSTYTAKTITTLRGSYGYSYFLGWGSFALCLFLNIGLGVANRR